jgi:predicted nucleotide-binding protein
MYYHVMIETTEQKTFGYVAYYRYDRANLDEIVDDVVIPFLKDEPIFFNGYNLNKSSVRRVRITQTQLPAEELKESERKRLLLEGKAVAVQKSAVTIYGRYNQDITDQVIKSATEKLNMAVGAQVRGADMSKIFIVHGHDDWAKTEVARFIEKLGFTPIILHEQASSGLTIIEKIEANSNVGFGVVLYTPCDLGNVKVRAGDLLPRARQNVVFEHGYLIGKLGRDKVCALVKDEVEKPNDISGVVYVQMDSHHAWHMKLAKEMKAAGYPVDMNKL